MTFSETDWDKLEVEMRQTVGLLEKGIQSGKESSSDLNTISYTELYDQILLRALESSSSDSMFFIEKQSLLADSATIKGE